MPTVMHIELEGRITGPGNCLYRLLTPTLERPYHSVVVTSAPGSLVSALRQIEVPTYHVPMLRYRKTVSPFTLAAYIANIAVSMKRFRRLFRKLDADLVHVNSTIGIQAGIAACLSKIPVVWHIHDILAVNQFNSLLLRMIFSASDRVVVVSNAVKRRLEREGGTGDKLTVIYNGLDVSAYELVPSIRTQSRERLSLQPKHVAVGLVGEFTERKGQHLLLQAAAVSRQDHPNVRYVLIGDAVSPFTQAYKRQLLKLVDRLDLGKVVLLAGYRSDIPEVLQTLDILVQPSPLPDPLPWSIIEGMAAGLPVVGSNCGGIPEQIADGETGILVKPGDVQGLARGIGTLVRSPQMRREMGSRGRQRAATHFGLERYVSAINDLFTSVMEERSWTPA